MTTTRFEALITTLAGGGVRFILVGGAAAVAHGAARLTLDVDVVYSRDAENIARLVAALRPHHPYPRGAPPGLPFDWSVETVQAGLNFTLETALGDLDLLGEITGGGGYEQLEPATQWLDAFGISCRCVTLRKLIALKRAAGRPRDFDAIAELEALLDEEQTRP